MSMSKSKVKIGLKQILSGTLTLMLVFTSIPFAGFTTHAAALNGGSSKKLQEKIDKAKDGDTIDITGTVTIDKEVEVNKSITLKGNGTLLRAEGYKGIIVRAEYNKNVTMEGITIDGNNIKNSTGSAVGIDRGSSLTMKSGTIKNNYSYMYAGGVLNDGTFIMHGGTIKNNTIDFYGGGVYNKDNATFEMYGGEISENTVDKGNGGGVYNNGNFTIIEGTISKNTANFGGGVYNNGVYNNGDATFEIYGGEISENTARADGGGVCNYYGTFNMNGGTITKNTVEDATCSGGGVYNNGNFAMTKGAISRNNANYGSGVCNNGNFTMTDGTISGNTSARGIGGGGVQNGGAFTMSGGTIRANTTEYNGGGVLNVGYFTMTGGVISENIAKQGGGGVFNRKSFKVQGEARIENNGKEENNTDKSNNVRFDFESTNGYITVIGEFRGSIGLRQSFDSVAVKAADGYTLTQDDANCFKADVLDADLSLTDNTLVYTRSKTEWGQRVQNNGVTYYVNENGKASAEITDVGKVWLNTKPDGSGSWYCIDNINATFKIGSRFYIQIIDDISKYYDKIGSEYRDKIEDGKLKIFLIGVTDPDGKEYTNLDTDLTCYIKVNPNWDKDKIRAIFINGEKSEKVDIEYMGTLDSPSTGDKFIKLTLKHFSPYAIYQAKSQDNVIAEDSVLDNAFATGENVNYRYILGFSTMAIAALIGIMFTKKKFNR